MKEPVMRVFGVGGGGCNTINELNELNAELVAVNTDASALLNTNAPLKVLIGKSLTKGRSTGGDMSLGERCAKYDVGKLSDAVGEPHLFFITCGLGGGTGSGASPVIAELAQVKGALTIAIVTLPFSSEGTLAKKNAEKGLKQLRNKTDAVILIPNDHLLSSMPNLPMDEAFGFLDQMTASMIRELIGLVGEHGLVNLGLADLRSILHDGKTAMVAIGRANDAKESIERAMKSVASDISVGDVTGLLVNVTGGKNLALADVEKIAKIASTKMPKAGVIWGAQINDEMDEGEIKTLLIMSK